MDWYFRTHQWRLVVKDKRPRVTVTGYSILNTLVGLGIAVFKYIVRKDQPVLTGTDLIVGSLIFVGFVPSIIWLMESLLTRISVCTGLVAWRETQNTQAHGSFTMIIVLISRVVSHWLSVWFILDLHSYIHSAIWSMFLVVRILIALCKYFALRVFSV